MANAQFVIPGTLENKTLKYTDQEVDQAFSEVVAQNPELQKTPYSEILDKQVDLEELRAFATEANLPRTLSQRIMSLFAPAPRPLDERLVDAESKIGGEIFFGENAEAVSARFWYFEGDWFFERNYANDGYKVIRYQVFENSMHKLYDGVEYPFSEGEQGTLLDAIHRYHDTVSRNLYGVSKDYALAA